MEECISTLSKKKAVVCSLHIVLPFSSVCEIVNSPCPTFHEYILSVLRLSIEAISGSGVRICYTPVFIDKITIEWENICFVADRKGMGVLFCPGGLFGRLCKVGFHWTKECSLSNVEWSMQFPELLVVNEKGKRGLKTGKINFLVGKCVQCYCNSTNATCMCTV